MPKNDRPRACPGCQESPEAGDLFCGACGTDLHPAKPAHPPMPPTPPPAPAVPSPGGNAPRSPAAVDRVGGTDTADVPTTTSLRTRTEREATRGAVAVEGASAVDGPDPAPRPADAAEGPGGGDRAAAADETRGTRDDSPAGDRCVACDTGSVSKDGHCTHCGHKQPLARDHWEFELSGVAGASDRGLRHRRNEDFFTLACAETPEGGPAGIAVVCDGVSSARRSDQASEAAAEAAGASLRESIPRGVHTQQAMHDALVVAAEAVDALATDEEREIQQNAPACTIVGAVVAASILTVGWVGDSRAYWVPDDRGAQPARLTEDDSWAAQMVAAGLMSEARAYADARAHAITGWLGADAYEVDPHTASFKPDRPGVVIVCSDGLWNYAESAEQMAATVPSDAGERPMAAARHLVGFALDGGGHDNVTVAVVPFTTSSEPESSS